MFALDGPTDLLRRGLIDLTDAVRVTFAADTI